MSEQNKELLDENLLMQQMMMNGVDPEEDEEEKKKKKLVLILLLSLVMLLLGGIFLWLYNVYDADSNSLERELAAEYGFLPGMSDEDIQSKLNEIIDKSMLNVSINPTPVFENGKAAGNLRIENIPNNHYAFIVQIENSKSGEVYLKTGAIEPGQFLENRALDVNLKAGDYECIAYFIAYDLETSVEIGRTGTPIVITIRN